jgi:hypothetical protein
MFRCTKIYVLTVLLQALLCPARAVIFHATADPLYNTSPPGGALANSGWQLQGRWHGVLGTPIGPNHFITATHVGGAVGDTFTLNGAQYITTARHVDANSDLTIWQVSTSFNDWAPLYTTSDEAGKNFVVFGRGTKRGAAVQVGAGLTAVTKGWLWGDHDGVIRWGENTVEEILDVRQVALGPLLRATFDSGAGPNEAMLSFGDSSGAAFINDAGTWKLAGINYAVDGPYNTAPTGTGFFGCIFDEGGLYKGGEGSWVLTPDLPTRQGGAFFMTRISARTDWIRSVVGDPGVPDPAPVLEYATALNATFQVDSSAVFDQASTALRTPNTGEQRFFRIRANQLMEILNLRREGTDLVFECRYK